MKRIFLFLIFVSTCFAQSQPINPMKKSVYDPANLSQQLAPITSPHFAGTPTAPTATTGTNNTQLATTAFVLSNSSSPSGAIETVQYNNAGAFGGTASFVMSGATVTGWSNSASQLTLAGTVSDGTTDTVRFTSAGRTDTTINAAMGNIGVLGFSTAGVRDWNIFNEGGGLLHFAKNGGPEFFTLSSAGAFKFTQLTSNGFLQTSGSDGTVSVATTSNTVAFGVPVLVSSANLLAQSAAVTSITTVTSPNDGSQHTYQIGVYTNITAISAGTLTVVTTYTDENNVSQTLTHFPMGVTTAGLVGTSGNTDPSFPVATIRVKANTAVVVKTTFSGVSITYDVGATITQIQ